MLKELEEPGKERMRHLNHRKEKAPPATDSERKSNMQSNPQTKLHPDPSHAWLVAWRTEQTEVQGASCGRATVGRRPRPGPIAAPSWGRGRTFLSAHLVGPGQSPGLRPLSPPLGSRVSQGTARGKTWAGPHHVRPRLERTSWAAASEYVAVGPPACTGHRGEGA